MISSTNKKKKQTVKGTTYSRKGMTYALAIGATVVVTSVNVLLGMDARTTISVLGVKEGEVLNKGIALSSELCYEKEVTKKDYTPDMILYKDKDKYYGNYASNFIRGGNAIHVDEVSETRPVRNAWLYDLPADSEVVTIAYTPTELAGKLLSPGDNIRIRATYTDNSGDDAVKVTTDLVSCVTVRDLLNSSNESVYDIYSELNKMSDVNKRKAMQSSEFSSSIQPVSIMVALPSSVALDYTRYKNEKKATFTMTLLSRNEADASVMEDIPIVITSDVESWVGSTSSSLGNSEMVESAEKNNTRK